MEGALDSVNHHHYIPTCCKSHLLPSGSKLSAHCSDLWVRLEASYTTCSISLSQEETGVTPVSEKPDGENLLAPS